MPDLSPAPEPATGARPGRGRKITVATIAALGLTAGGIAIAEAASADGTSAQPSGSSSGSSSASKPANAPRPPAPSKYDLDGTVTAVSSKSITVRSLTGTSRTYTITSDTTVHRGPTKSSVSSLASGDRVHVRGGKSGSSYTAKDLDVRLAHIDGAVKSSSGDTITVTDPDGFTRTIHVTSSTTYAKSGKSSSRSAVTTGSVVHAEGKVDSDGTTLDASHVELGMPAGRPGGPMGGPPAPPAGGPGGHGQHGPGTSGKSGSGTSGKGAPSKSGAPSAAPSSAPSGGSGSGS